MQNSLSDDSSADKCKSVWIDLIRRPTGESVRGGRIQDGWDHDGGVSCVEGNQHALLFKMCNQDEGVIVSTYCYRLNIHKDTAVSSMKHSNNNCTTKTRATVDHI